MLGEEGQKWLACRLYMLNFIKRRRIFGHRNRFELRDARVLLNTIPHLLESSGENRYGEERMSKVGLFC